MRYKIVRFQKLMWRNMMRLTKSQKASVLHYSIDMMIIIITNKHFYYTVFVYGMEIYILVLGIYYNCICKWNDILYILKKI
jgi:hypothetical protein